MSPRTPARPEAEARSAAPSADRTRPSMSICRTTCAAPGADGGADRDLAVPPRRAHQQQVGHVRARDEQHEQDADLQHAGAACARRRRVCSRMGTAYPLKPLAWRKPRTAAAARGCASTIVFICASSCSIVAPGASRAIIELNSLPRALSDICRRRERERHEQRDVARRQLEVRRQDADDAVRLAIEPDVAADDGRVGAEARHSRGRR